MSYVFDVFHRSHHTKHGMNEPCSVVLYKKCNAHCVTVHIAGYRSVPLKNGFSEEMEISSLLVLIDVRNPKV